MTQTESATIRDGVLVGPIRHSINSAQDVKGSIHDDATATKLGLRGGTVAGSIHMDLFGPHFLQLFGEDWWERGNLSLDFKNATVDREPVRAYMKLPAEGQKDVQVDVWVEREDGMLVAQGTAALGNPAEKSALLAKEIRTSDPSELRILKNLHEGMPIATKDAIFTSELHAQHMELTTEPLEMHKSSKWGAPVVPLRSYVTLLYSQAISDVRSQIGDVVGLFGAIEIRNINGPLLVDVPYRVGGEVVAIGQSPKTEYFWYETWADDQDGKRIAEHRMQLRFMKASSPLYAE